MSTTPEASESRRGLRALDRRTAAAIAVGLVVVLAAVWLLVLRSSPAPEPAAAPPPTPPTPEPQPAPKQPKAPPKAGGGPVETFQVFAPRDPFDPLVSTSAGGGTTDTSGTTTDTSGSTGITTGTGGAPDTSGTTGGTTGGSGGGTSVSGHTISVIDVFRSRGRKRAQVEVDGTVYKVDEGETFADNFKLLAASGKCAEMLFGDDQFTLCEGEEILK
jgi:hypothetical protein